MMTPNEGRERGQKRAERGIKRAAYKHKWDISRDQLKLLRLFLADPSRTATTDDIVDDLAKKYEKGGKWRGHVPRGLACKKAIRRVDVTDSCRPGRNSGTVKVWALANIHVARQCALALECYFLENPDRPVDPKDHNDEFAGTTEVPWPSTASNPVTSSDDQNEISPTTVC